MIKLIILLGLVFVCGCKNNETRVKTGIKRIVVVKKFNELLKDNHHSIAKHDGSPGPDIWLATAKIYDRYVIKMSFDYRDVDSKGNLSTANNFNFQLSEHSYNKGRWVSEGIGKLSLKEWHGVVTIEDVFSLIGVIPEKNAPIKELVEKFEKDKQASD
jgi:hypothetical protein